MTANFVQKPKNISRTTVIIGRTYNFISRKKNIISRTNNFIGRVNNFIGRTDKIIGRVLNFIGRINKIIGRVLNFIGRTNKIIGRVNNFIGRVDNFNEFARPTTKSACFYTIALYFTSKLIQNIINEKQNLGNSYYQYKYYIKYNRTINYPTIGNL